MLRDALTAISRGAAPECRIRNCAISMTTMRFTDIAAILARRISDGTYAVGTLMPAERILMEEFETSRHTIRAAIAQLQDARLVSRQRGSGTLVEARNAPTEFAQSLSSLEDLMALAATSPRQLQAVENVVVDVDMARLLKIGAGTRWLHFKLLRLGRDGIPIVLTDVYVDARYDVRRVAEKSPGRLICMLIEEQYGLRIASVQQDISACTLPDEIADQLRAPRGSPGLLILRQYRDAAQNIIEASTSYHPAEHYKFSITLVRGK